MSAIVHLGDCRRVMADMPPHSVDAVVTDPPYGLEFMGASWDRGVPGPEFWQGMRRVAKPGAHLVAFGSPRTMHRLWCAVEDGGWEIRDTLCWLYGTGFPKSLNLEGDWKGWGTALKPGWEPILLARAPFTGPVARNVELCGTGALNIARCRIPTEPRPAIESARRDGNAVYDKGLQGSKAVGTTDLPRWPTNVLLDLEAAGILDEEVGDLKSGANPTSRGSDKFHGVYSDFPGQRECAPARGADSGPPSRFFYCAKASREEREEALDHLQPVLRTDGRAAVDGPGAQNPRLRATARRNHHPTVKPLALMQWLVRLVTPPGGVVLDPFAGSGTTLVACQREFMDGIGIEDKEAYVEIARGRLSRPTLPLEGALGPKEGA